MANTIKIMVNEITDTYPVPAAIVNDTGIVSGGYINQDTKEFKTVFKKSQLERGRNFPQVIGYSVKSWNWMSNTVSVIYQVV